MKALAVKQPWACLLCEGVKKVEVRSWGTKYRGNLLICASASPKDIFWFDGERKVHRLLHAGCHIGIVNLTEVRPMVNSDEESAMCGFKQGAYAWIVSPVAWCKPKKVIGKIGLFDVQDGEIERLHENQDVEWIFDYPTPQGVIKYVDGKYPLLTK